ncbi:PREDICTED: uncharacterized protein LOC104798888 [Tarenaya hassleriana]|uniref:uncharacterized protein LOC104798888 n=1 Tax=Tarenaya hassleriana TaxID=28532 RepID=UPI00053CA0B8|nr:PREDICTED: uncharacterized protein LOC104798888 [Tarenaya hassleriana]
MVYDNVVRVESFIETSTRKASALFKFMQKPKQERLWMSGLEYLRNPQFWEDLLQEGVWLNDQHIDEAMYDIRKRVLQTEPNSSKYLLCDVQCCECFKWWKLGQKDLGLLGQYMSGELPIDGGKRKLDQYKGFISVLNIPSLVDPYVSVHWVTIRVDYRNTSIQVYDCNPRMKEATLKVIHHLCRSIDG